MMATPGNGLCGARLIHLLQMVAQQDGHSWANMKILNHLVGPRAPTPRQILTLQITALSFISYLPLRLE